MAMLAPHRVSKSELEVEQQLEQANLPKRPLPVGSKGWSFKMEQKLWALPFVLVLLRLAGLCLGFAEEMTMRQGVPHSPRLCSTGIKLLFFCFSTYFEFGFCGSRQANSPFCGW